MSVRLLLDRLRQLDPSPAALALPLRELQGQPIGEMQEWLREASHLLYVREESPVGQLRLLELMRLRLLDGSFPFFLLFHVYVAPYLLSLNSFQPTHPLPKRAHLLYAELPLPRATPSAQLLRQYEQLLTLAQEFVVFFGEALKFHPCSKYKVRCGLARALQEGGYSRKLTHFEPQDGHTLQQNLKSQSRNFAQELKQLVAFVTDKTEEALVDPAAYHDNLYLLLSLAETADSYCIGATVHRLALALREDPQQLLPACLMLHTLAATAEIETISVINWRCLPPLLEYILPVDFRNDCLIAAPLRAQSSAALAKVIDYFYVWRQMTTLVGLSDRVYAAAFQLVQKLRPIPPGLVEREMRDFGGKLDKMSAGNQMKRAFVVDQHAEDEAQVVRLIQEVAFCIGSQQQQAAPQPPIGNVLDDLTITDEEISAFSISLMRSATDRANHNNSLNSSKDSLPGPPHKKFGSSKDSKSSSLSKRSQSKGSGQPHSRSNPNQDIENIYYSGAKPTSKNVPATPYFPGLTASRHQQHESHHTVSHPSHPRINAANSSIRSKPKPSPFRTAPQDSLSLHSSQFSQKDNREGRGEEVESIYLNRQKEDHDPSGEFVYFEKHSDHSDRPNTHEKQEEEKSVESGEVEFEDSLRLNPHSASEDLVEYGMDKQAKLPPTVQKPKFSFKPTDTRDSSRILLGLEEEERPSPTPNSAKPREIVIPSEKQPLPAKDRQSSSLVKQKKKEMSKEKEREGNLMLRSLKDEPEVKSKIHMKSSREPPKSERKDRDNMHSPQSMDTPLQSKQFKQARSQYGDHIFSSSGSLIHQNSAQPHLQSQSPSISQESIPSRFGSLFRKKKEKASLLSSSRSLKHIPRPTPRPVDIPDLRELHELENELGQLKKETTDYQRLLKEKEREIGRLEREKQERMANDPYCLTKENQILQLLLKGKQREKQAAPMGSSGRSLGRELKESSLRNYNSLKDYNPEVLKLRLNVEGYSRELRKNVISSRCVLLKNELAEVGYSCKNKTVTLYLTLHRHCSALSIQLVPNSLRPAENLNRTFAHLPAHTQMKFKTEVPDTQDTPEFTLANLVLSLTYDHHLKPTTQTFTAVLPLTPYSLARPLSPGETEFSRQRSVINYVTPLYGASEQLVRKGKGYLQQLFPHAHFNEEGDMSLHYEWKGKTERITVKLKERAFRVEGSGHPQQAGCQLITTIANLLTDP